MGIQTIATGVFGPLPEGTVGLLLGRSSTTLKGLSVAPGVIDSDYHGEIKIMAESPRTISTIHSGQRIAQLVLLPLKVTGHEIQKTRGTAAFGSSDAYWVQAIKESRPELELKINGKNFKGILDTGADVSVIAEHHWPSGWPKHIAISTLQGIGQSSNPEQSAELLHWQDQDGHQGEMRPYILPRLPVNLWGRDVMSKMGVFLYSPSTAISSQMFDQGLLPHQGLGKHGQGRIAPIQPQKLAPRAGLGYFQWGLLIVLLLTLILLFGKLRNLCG